MSGEWATIGSLYYFDADTRDRGLPLPNDGRGILTWHGRDGKVSGGPPDDDLRLTWDGGLSAWMVQVPEGSDAAYLWGADNNYSVKLDQDSE